MADRIKGITVKIGGDTTGLTKALSGVNQNIKSTQSQLKDVERLLKLDPKNTDLLRQRQELLAKAVEETKEKLNALKEAEVQVQQQVKEGKASQEQYEALQREITSTALYLEDLEKAAEKSNASLAKIGAIADEVSEKTGKIADKTKALSAGAAGLLTAAGAASISYEKDFAKVSTLLDNAKTDYDEYKKSIIEGSNETGVAISEYSEAVYSAISASVDQGKAVQFVTDANKLAKGGFTDLTKSVDVITTAINGYRLAEEDAMMVADKLITTQNLGKTTVDELAGSMGKVIPTASAANFSIDELSASYALMTKNGIATAESGTYLRSMLSELTKSGSKTDAALRELTGKGFADLKKEGKSTSEIFSLLSDYANKNGQTLKDMFGSVEAGSAAMMIARADGKEYNEILKQMEQSAGATEEAYNKMSDTSGNKMAKSFNQMKNTAIELGDTLAPVIEFISDLLQKMTGFLSGLDDEQLKMIGTILLVIASISPVFSIISKITGGISQLTGAIQFLLANPIVLLIAGIVALVALIATKGDEIQEILQNVDNFVQNVFAADWTTVFGPVLGEALNGFFATVKSIWDSVMLVLNGVIDFVRGVFSGDWERAWKGVQEIFGGLFGGLVALAKAPLNSVISLINGMIGSINWVIRKVNQISFKNPFSGEQVGFNFGEIGNVPYLAKGGILYQGSAVVGEAGPELLTMEGNRAIVQPLTSQTTNHNMGGVVFNIYGAPGQDVEEIADAVEERIEARTQQKGAVFA